ncbi:hypothetical protein [Dethiosulfovibrio salsuginis]|uniref:Uncharacterized protein n=1 Tax=Dethiosulfovibrio salsuginis TaxID=561720 RepID=A0A1X7IPL4_9BACT|nr:hypothetical protein [Dethiosulfovibrio salsuginis]SMG16695.1 hypothetical protein SAMN06275492_10413 [Dethiosulfovibrio salsuginis]
MRKKAALFGGIGLALMVFMTMAMAGSYTFEDVVKGLKDFKDGKVNISYVQERIAGFLGIEDVPFRVRLNREIRRTPGKGIVTFWSLNGWVNEDDSRIASVRISVEGGGEDLDGETADMVYSPEDRAWYVPDYPKWNELPSQDMALNVTLTLKDGSTKSTRWTANLGSFEALKDGLDGPLASVKVTKNGSVLTVSDDMALILDPFGDNLFGLDISSVSSDRLIAPEKMWGYIQERVRDGRGQYRERDVLLKDGKMDLNEEGWKDVFFSRGSLSARFYLADSGDTYPDNFSLCGRFVADIFPDVVVTPRVEMRRFYDSNGDGTAYSERVENKRLRLDFYSMVGERRVSRLRATLGDSEFVMDAKDPTSRFLSDWMVDEYGEAVEGYYRLRELFPDTIEGEKDLKVEIFYEESDGSTVSRNLSMPIETTMDPGRFPVDPRFYAMTEGGEEREITQPAIGESDFQSVRFTWDNSDQNAERYRVKSYIWAMDVENREVEFGSESWNSGITELSVDLDDDDLLEDWIRGDLILYMDYSDVYTYTFYKPIFKSADPVITGSIHLHRFMNDGKPGGDYFDLWFVPRIMYPSWTVKQYRMPDLRKLRVPIEVNGGEFWIHGFNQGGYNDSYGFDAEAKLSGPNLVWSDDIEPDGWKANVSVDKVNADLRRDWTFEVTYTDNVGTFTETITVPLGEVSDIVPDVKWFDKDGPMADSSVLWRDSRELLGAEVSCDSIRDGFFTANWSLPDGTSNGNWNNLVNEGGVWRNSYQIPDGVGYLGGQIIANRYFSGSKLDMLYFEHRYFRGPVQDLWVGGWLNEEGTVYHLHHMTLAVSEEFDSSILDGAVIVGPWDEPVPIAFDGSRDPDPYWRSYQIDLKPMEGIWSNVDMSSTDRVEFRLVSGSETIALWTLSK